MSKTAERLVMPGFSNVNGRTGRMIVTGMCPVVAGDSFELDATWIIRLAPLRQALSIAPEVLVASFYIPHWQIYGKDTWQTFMKQGMDGVTTLPSITPSAWAGSHHYSFSYSSALGWHLQGGQPAPKWRVLNVNKIFNQWFKYPTMTADIPDDYTVMSNGWATGHTAADSSIDGGAGKANQLVYGYRVCRLPTPWNQGIVGNLDASDYQMELPVSGTATFDLLENSKQKALLKSEIENNWWGNRYRDLMARKYGAHISTDIDERPRLLGLSKGKIGGIDINGTGDGNLGNYSGKAAGAIHHVVPRVYIPEHGAVTTVMVLRFPPVVIGEWNPLASWASPTYKQLAHDPAVHANEPPVDGVCSEWFNNGSSNSLGKIPFGEHYKHLPNIASSGFQHVDGFPILRYNSINTHAAAVYEGDTDYDHIFLSQPLGHYYTQGETIHKVIRRTPSHLASIYAGTK